MSILNLFYEEPDPDRWVPFDRIPRRVIRRILRGKPVPGGQTRVFLNLCAGLDRIGFSYRINDYDYIRRHPSELACIIGKPFLLDKIAWENPILFGSAIFSHPSDDPSLLTRLPIKKVLVPGPWMKDMCEPYWGDIVSAWPVGIDTDFWSPMRSERKPIDVLLYNKVRWDHERYNHTLIEPIRALLWKRGHTTCEMRYGFYREEHFREALAQCRVMIFLCEHETQGIAYQQALSCDVPILAWDRQGTWRDPAYYPNKVIFEPVTSVPYWDDRCGLRFSHEEDFDSRWDEFWNAVQHNRFAPRDYILENLALENCARQYDEIAQSVASRT